MKKVSVSLVAVLAIVFALSTAFKTASKTALLNYPVYGISAASAITFNSTPSNFNGIVSTIEAGSPVSNPGDAQISNLQDFATTNELCEANVEHDYLCLAQVDATQQTHVVIKVADGDFAQ